MQEELGLSLDFLSLFDLIQLQFFQGSLTELERLSSGLSNQVVQALSSAVTESDFVHTLRTSGGWDVIGVRGDFGISGLHGLNLSGDILFNFHSLELSAGINANYTLGIQAGVSFAAGVFVGFNAPTNNAFAGWGSGMSISIASPTAGVTVQGDVSDRIFLLSNMMPERHTIRRDDPMDLTVMYTTGAEIEFSATVAGYSLIFSLYQW